MTPATLDKCSTTGPLDAVTAAYIATCYQREAKRQADMAILWLDTANILRKEDISHGSQTD
jgi:hypothetical protein